MASIPPNKKRSAHLSRKFGSMFLNERSTTRDLVGNGIQEIHELTKQRGWEIFLFGGVPRSVWVSDGPVRVRDFDMVAADECFDELRYALSEYIIRENRFGGIKLLIDNVEFDVWSLSSTWAFKTGLVAPARFELLPETVFLNIDSIVIELAPPEGVKRRVFQAGFYRSVRDKCLDICLHENPYPELCAVRALRMAQVMEFKISRRLSHYIVDVLSANDPISLNDVQLNHYGRIIFDTDCISRLGAIIEKNLEVCDRDEINLFGGLIQHQFDFQ